MNDTKRDVREIMIENEAARISVAVTGEIYDAFDRLDINRAELARRLGVSKAHVTRLLDGEDKNFTLKTLASLGIALGFAWGVSRVCEVTGWVARGGDPQPDAISAETAMVPSPSGEAALAIGGLRRLFLSQIPSILLAL